MPRVFSFDQMSEEQLAEMEAREDDMDFDPYAAPPSAFVYLKPPDFGGPRSPVQVVVRQNQIGKMRDKPSMIEKLLAGRNYLAEKDQYQVRAEHLSATISEALVAMGASRAYCRYDGGNDEGFAWLDYAVMKDGSTRSSPELTSELDQRGIFAALELGGDLKYVLEDAAVGYWAATLLGRGFGTGEYVMYGAFWVNLETGDVSDDAQATPVVKNITLKPD